MISSILIFAQETAPDYAMQMTETTGGATGEINFLTMFLKGGYILIPIVFLSFVAVYLIIRKYLDINKNLVFDPGYVAHFNDLLKKGEIKAATAHLEQDNSSYANIFRRAIVKIGKPTEEIESTLESASNIEVAKVSKHLGYLGLIAGIAPMLGFIGTISGIIKIFYNISLTDNISIGIISGGLYEKMISSGSGLIVGIIAFTGYHMLNMKIDRFISQIEEEAFEFMNIVSR
jgi:biopolymer transport protein ExbB